MEEALLHFVSSGFSNIQESFTDTRMEPLTMQPNHEVASLCHILLVRGESHAIHT